MEQLVDVYGAPVAIQWAKNKGIKLRYIQPGKPNQTASIERFNKSFRSEVLDAYLLNNLSEAQKAADHWVTDYNEKRPHESLGNVPPMEHMPRTLICSKA